MEFSDQLLENLDDWKKWIKEKLADLSKLDLPSNKTLSNYKVENLALTIGNLPTLKLNNKSFNGFNFDFIKWVIEVKNSLFENCTFYQSNFDNSVFYSCRFKNCIFDSSFFINVNFNFSTFENCSFLNIKFGKSDFYSTIFKHSQILNSVLIQSKFIEVELFNSKINNCKIYGAAIWNLKIDKATETTNLIISKKKELEIKIDNIEIANFIYLLINNEKLRDVITTLTSKIVLLLGRFTSERLDVLTKVKEHLSSKGLVPVIFTFEPSKNRDLTETIILLASISKFVIADITEPKSIPQELSQIIEKFPSLFVYPIILESEREYAMFEHWNHYPWVQPIIRYKNEHDLLKQLP